MKGLYRYRTDLYPVEAFEDMLLALPFKGALELI